MFPPGNNVSAVGKELQADVSKRGHKEVSTGTGAEGSKMKGKKEMKEKNSDALLLFPALAFIGAIVWGILTAFVNAL